MKRREAREKAVQTLFQLDNTTMELSVDEAIHYITERPANPFYEQLVRGTVQHKSEIDAALTERLENWSLERLPKIERTVLRLAVYELLFTDDAPHRVILNEAVELCKTFGDEKSGRFVNGVLSKFDERSTRNDLEDEI
ncbi:N utilization substance protein b-like protein [Bacillus sp. OxB-1]|uniref:transcription antitermination factor NusB n=1 Tax=Bacillus sp. (strain OxB-1) TaxID=98228 RepID=UPI000581CDB8|nr:transcription antitermination factor NusB [Bacillus sp. OxB-1]BAQ11219.1 N utilization substance protein b-like protein [Bacillus sp. OxB-1]